MPRSCSAARAEVSSALLNHGRALEPWPYVGSTARVPSQVRLQFRTLLQTFGVGVLSIVKPWRDCQQMCQQICLVLWVAGGSVNSRLSLQVMHYTAREVLFDLQWRASWLI